ncbi:helix-turn-helix transcriptional regulator [Pseudoalteromonas arctica]|uniref:Helix-turn-helix domain-containing protein n=1 Tax=Pseudoalteromonas arctica TaxID=394751 RepID=A0A7Y0HB58_9GAMM|nr:helix-turn-helix domain-containing protein [Pseudoalteromonas arctica]NMM41331.1 helix-turn-helix domain-containing protein [Pseudoalteromonas arctica]
MSQQELADAINVSRKTICTVETSHFTPSVIIALKIAQHFSTSVERLFILDEHD